MQHDTTNRIAFGPVPSRRLGHSVGINNIPPKICTYSCVYCQLGRSLTMRGERQGFYDPHVIYDEVAAHVNNALSRNEQVDYLTFVADGEPTLDAHLGHDIELLKRLGIKIAVMTNASLLWNKDIRDAVCQADWVSVKVDAAARDVWRKIDRPYGMLHLEKIFQGIVDFSHMFTGTLMTETMLIRKVNDHPEELRDIAAILAEIQPQTSWIAIPTRPPAEHWVEPATEETITMAYQIFCDHRLSVEYLIGYEGNAFACTGNVAEDLLSITAVHPMKEEAVQALLDKSNATWRIVETLLEEKRLIRMTYRNTTFYMRTL